MAGPKERNILKQATNFQTKLQSNPVNMDSEGAIESVHINRVSVISGLNLEKMKGLSFPRDKANCL